MAYHFGGYATRANLKCSDGRTILKDAFKHHDGQTVPLVWMHRHDEPFNVLGHALLENRADGVYAYCTFNDTESGRTGKLLVEHGDVTALSIYANELKQQKGNVIHGMLREVSLVLAGRNPGAFIDSVLSHGEESDEEGIIYTGEEFTLAHAEEPKKDDPPPKKDDAEDKTDGDETVADVFNTLSEKQKTVVYAMIGQALEEGGESEDESNNKSEGGKDPMKHNAFDKEDVQENGILMHAEQMKILELAKSKSVGSLQEAIKIYAEQADTMKHGFDDADLESLFPEFQLVNPGAPEQITRDYGWVTAAMNKAHKSPFSRIRTRQADVRSAELTASGYKKGAEKRNTGKLKLLNRTTDPQTVYVKDSIDRDDVIDIVDFDVVAYQYSINRGLLNEKLAICAMIGDGKDDGDEGKVAQEHIRSIWLDDDVYTIHADVDIEAAREELQGTNTGANFGENYIYAEAIITAALYAREQYKGTGSMDFYCTPHLLNVMLLARDLNGRRIYDSKADLAQALNVGEIYTAEQFESKTRVAADSKTKKLLGIFVNMADYSIGSTKKGQVAQFHDFDIDFNKEKFLIETRLSGALTRAYSAIALEEDVTNAAG